MLTNGCILSLWGILKKDMKLKECKGVFKLWWKRVDNEIKEFALDSHVVELCNHYVSTDNVVKMYVKVLNGGGNEVAVGGNENAQGGNEVVTAGRSQ